MCVALLAITIIKLVVSVYYCMRKLKMQFCYHNLQTGIFKDINPLFRFAAGNREVRRVVAGRLELDLVSAPFADGHRRGQRHPEIGVVPARIRPPGRNPNCGLWIQLFGLLSVWLTIRKALVTAVAGGVDAVLDFDGVVDLRGARADLRFGTGDDVPGLLTGLGERPAVGDYQQVDVELGQGHAAARR